MCLSLDFDFNLILKSLRPAHGLPISRGFLGGRDARLGHPRAWACLSPLLRSVLQGGPPGFPRPASQQSGYDPKRPLLYFADQLICKISTRKWRKLTAGHNRWESR